MPANRTAAESFCVFQAEGLWFAISAMQIREIAQRPNLAHVPLSHSGLAGIFHQGSEFVPVLRLPQESRNIATSNLDAVQPHSPTSGGQMLVMDGPNGVWGLLVDQVHGIEPLECSHDRDTYRDDWSQAVMGTSTWRQEVVRILSADGAYRHVEQKLMQIWSCLSIASA